MKKFLIKVFLNPNVPAAVLAGFISVISFFQVDSFAADQHKLNPFWIIVGIISGLVTFYFGYKVVTTSRS